MILRYATNLKLAKELYQASKPKLQEDKGMIELFEHTFGLQKELVKYVGIAEATTAALYSASFINKKHFSPCITINDRHFKCSCLQTFRSWPR
ncbi:Uncharacterised protein [Staphylococcus aureus]|nr:Uncharacterised protein [Staphylococcus aureus]